MSRRQPKASVPSQPPKNTTIAGDLQDGGDEPQDLAAIERQLESDYDDTLSKPLSHLTKKNVPFQFDEQCQEVFQELKRRLIEAPILRHYDYNLETMLETDALDGVIAGILSQKHADGNWYPVGYFSKTMAPAELNY